MSDPEVSVIRIRTCNSLAANCTHYFRTCFTELGSVLIKARSLIFIQILFTINYKIFNYIRDVLITRCLALILDLDWLLKANPRLFYVSPQNSRKIREYFVAESIDQRKDVHIIFLKSFWLLDYIVLLKKLGSYGFSSGWGAT